MSYRPDCSSMKLIDKLKSMCVLIRMYSIKLILAEYIGVKLVLVFQSTVV